MRKIIVAAVCLVFAGCSSADPQSGPPANPGPDRPSSGSSTASDASGEPCELLSQLELAALVDAELSEPREGVTGGLASCQWASADGTYVQTITASSSQWARSLPDILRMLESSGLLTDSDNMRKLREGADMVEAGGDLNSDEACSMFSAMVEQLQGLPAGTPWVVNVVPNRQDPLAVTGQMCRGGMFTSVMVARESGLDGRLPIQEVAKTLKSAHRRAERS